MRNHAAIDHTCPLSSMFWGAIKKSWNYRVELRHVKFRSV